MFMKTTILFIGGGYSSVWAYRQLASSTTILKKIKKGEVELKVICDRKHHYFHGFTGDVIGGHIPEMAVLTPLKTLIPDAQFIYGKATQVSPFMNMVKYTTSEGQTKEVKYDHLVVGCGTVDNETNTLDFEVDTIHVKKPKGLYNFKKELNHLLGGYEAEKDHKFEKPQEHIVLLGSGFTSVEIATNLAEYVNQTHQGVISVALINSRDKILKEWQNKQPRLVKYAEKALTKNGVKVYNNCVVVDSNPEGVTLSNGVFLKTRLVVNAVGQQPVALLGLRHLCLNPEGKIETNRYLNALGYSNIWCGGDIALVKRPFSKGFCPPNALWAIMQGARIGKNIKRVMSNKAPRKFWFPGLGQAAAFGVGKGALELYGIPFWGWLAYIIRLGFFFYFFPAKSRLIKIIWQFYKDKKNPNEKASIFKAEYRDLIISNEKQVKLKSA